MTGTFRLTMAQMNPTLGDLAGNRAKAREAHAAGKAAGADFGKAPVDITYAGKTHRGFTWEDTGRAEALRAAV